MDSWTAFGMGEANRGKELMVFDWEKAARIIKDSGAQSAYAGLRGDWEYTGGGIFRDGKPIPKDKTYVYLASTWATPELEIEGQVIACFRMESKTPGWNEDTYWPEEALKILEGGNE